MLNHAYLVDWDDGGGWGVLTQYVVVFDPDSKLGEAIDKGVFQSEEKRLKELDKILTESFGITDSEVCFYYGAGKEPSIKELKAGVRADGDIIIKEIHEKVYERTI